jgi:hypothetical protein
MLLILGFIMYNPPNYTITQGDILHARIELIPDLMDTGSIGTQALFSQLLFFASAPCFLR